MLCYFINCLFFLLKPILKIGRKILSTLGILKEKAQPIIQTVQKGWDVARDATNLIPNPETRGKVQGWMDNVGRQAGNYYNKANDYYNQAGHYMDQGERFIIRQITESELKQKVTQCICQPNNFTKQKLKLLVKLTILILTIKKLNFIFYLKKSSYII